MGNGTLYFPPFRAEDYREDVHSAVYRCRASNAGGTVLSREVRVRAARFVGVDGLAEVRLRADHLAEVRRIMDLFAEVRRIADRLAEVRRRADHLASPTPLQILVVHQPYTVQVYRAHVLLGNTAVLRCNIPAFVKDYVTVTSWLRDDVIILPGRDDAGERFVVTSSGDLHIRGAKPEDGVPRYSCLTLHALTGERMRSAPAALTVTDPTGSMPPRLTQRSLTSLRADQGSDVHLSCAAQGHPPPTFTWLRETAGGQLRAVSPSLRVAPAHDVLHIRHVGPEDAGRWVCRVSNPFGEQRLDTQLAVAAPLAAHVHPQLQVVNSGESASFNCSVSGSPVDAVTWLHNGAPLGGSGAGGRVRLLGPLSLLVSTATRADRGMYQCVARNDRDSAQGSAELRLGDTLPELQSTFIEQALSPGPFVSLRCSASGSPPPHFTWALDGQPLTAASLGQRYTIGQYVDQAGDVISHLNISSVRVLDGGLYSCSAANSVGAAVHEARLNIYGPPYVRSAGPVHAVAGGEVVLRCPFAGHPVAAVSWERGGRPLLPDLRVRPLPGGALAIAGVEPQADAGSYTCVVRGAGGEAARQDLLLQVSSPPELQPFFFPANIHEGGRLQATCSVTSGDLPIRFSWLKDGKPIAPALDVEDRQNGEFFSMLVFNKVTSVHSGAYTCVARNNAAAVNHTAQLLVKVPPRWVREPQDASALAGGSAALHCQATGFPDPRVTWMRSDRASSEYQPLDSPSPPGAGLGGAVIGGVAGGPHAAPNGSLLFEAVSPADEGYYLCRADNGIGPGLSKGVQLAVNEPVRFEAPSRNVTARRGQAVTLTCNVLGDHPIQVDWHFNGQRLHRSYRVALSDSKTDGGLRSELVLTRADRQDSGVYTCQAGNVFGHSKMAIHLAVQEPPDPPLEVEVVEVSSRAVRLSWRPPFDGHSPLRGYLLQYKPALARPARPADWDHVHTANLSVPADTGLPTPGSDGPRSAVIGGLYPATTYHVRMLAINGIEPSAFTEPIAVKTQEEAPVGAPLDVRVETLSPEELLVTWKPPAPETWNGDLQGYTVEWVVHGAAPGDAEKSASHTVRGLAATELRLADLRKFTRYDVTVRAFNGVGPGPRSPPITATTQEGVPEAAPQNVSCAPLSSQSLKVSWAPPPPQLHGGIIQGYKVVYRPVLHDRSLVAAGSEVKRTSSLETHLHGLFKYTNYSVRLQAYTGVGEGVLSDPVSCTTEQDVPGPPAAIKALALTSDSVLVSWLPPEAPNGVIELYTVYVKEVGHAGKPSSFPVRLPAGADTVFEVRSLTERQRYEFYVTASTHVGEGEGVHPVVQTPNSRAPARIASFSQELRAAARGGVALRCVAVGNPSPSVRWLRRRAALRPHPRFNVSDHGTLFISGVEKEDEGNYTCAAENLFGTDTAMYRLVVLTAPSPPSLEVVHSSHAGLTFKWTAPEDGGAPLQGYVLSYKREHGVWAEVQLDSDRLQHTLQGLACGSTYHAYLTAHNRVGNSAPSATVTATTKGDVPGRPEQGDGDLVSANATSLHLHLSRWPDGGCPMLYFVVEYRPLTASAPADWALINNNAPAQPLPLPGLAPATWYELRLTAHNDAGSSRALLHVATTTLEGATIAPPAAAGGAAAGGHLFQDVYVVVAAVCAAVLLLSAALLAYIAIHRQACRHGMGYKRGQGLPESPSACKAAAEMDNKRNFQQIYSSSPGKGEDRPRGKSVGAPPSELYEMSPYATFAVPPDPARPVTAATLDYTVQFKTFGHSENDSAALRGAHREGHREGLREPTHRPQKKHRHTASDSEAAGRQAALAAARLRHAQLKAAAAAGRGGGGGGSGGSAKGAGAGADDSESDTSGSPSAASSYRVPLKQPAGSRSLELYRLDSSTESNETSPLPQRRRHSRPVERPPSHASVARRRGAEGPGAARGDGGSGGGGGSAGAGSPSESESSSADDDSASFSSYRLQPPSGFSDSRELSEAECDRDNSRLDKLLARFHQQKEQERMQFTIHV